MSDAENKTLTVSQPDTQSRSLSVFDNISAFESAQRMATAVASSDLAPAAFKGKVANCLIALDIAQRTGTGIMAVLQNIHIIHGRPSWSSQYIISAVNSCGRFAPLKFRMEGSGDARSCVAHTVDKDGEVLEGPPVTMKMAKDEGWLNKAGSKWQTMPELMLRYRAAAFFGRLYAPEILNGMRSAEEETDVIDVKAEVVDQPKKVDALNAKIKAAKKKPEPEPAPEQAEPNPYEESPF